jgi:hypothetical protein
MVRNEIGNDANRSCADIDSRKNVNNSAEEYWSSKSLRELERDADQVLNDIRNVVSSGDFISVHKAELNNKNNVLMQASNGLTKDVAYLQQHESIAAIPRHSDESESALDNQNSPRSTVLETLANRLEGDDYDDDSMNDELDRLDTVATTIRLSLDAKDESNILSEINSALFSQADYEFRQNSIPTKHINAVAQLSDTTNSHCSVCNCSEGFESIQVLQEIGKMTDSIVNSKSNCTKSKTESPNVADDVSLAADIVSIESKPTTIHVEQQVTHMNMIYLVFMIASLWVWIVYFMIIVSRCKILDYHGIVQLPICVLAQNIND